MHTRVAQKKSKKILNKSAGNPGFAAIARPAGAGGTAIANQLSGGRDN